MTLLKKWLVEYKFKNWAKHSSDSAKKGQKVTLAEKEKRATEIARLLGDNKLWHSHGRLIGPSTLQTQLRLQIDDYSKDPMLRSKIRSYNDLMTDYIARSGFTFFMHNRVYF